MRKYTVLIHEAQGCATGYRAEVEQIPGLNVYSDNLGRLSQDLQETVEAHLSKLKAAGQPLPESFETDDLNTRRWQIAVAD